MRRRRRGASPSALRSTRRGTFARGAEGGEPEAEALLFFSPPLFFVIFFSRPPRLWLVLPSSIRTPSSPPFISPILSLFFFPSSFPSFPLFPAPVRPAGWESDGAHHRREKPTVYIQRHRGNDANEDAKEESERKTIWRGCSVGWASAGGDARGAGIAASRPPLRDDCSSSSSFVARTSRRWWAPASSRRR